MAGTLIANATYNSSTDWEGETLSKDIIQKGWYNMAFTNMDNNSLPTIIAGSSVDIDGNIYIFEEDQVVTGTVVWGTNYVRVWESGGVALTELNASSFDYDYIKKGWYSGSYRYIFQFDYDSLYDEYNNKYTISDKSEKDYGLALAIDILDVYVQSIL
jgi:hypothetical protein